MMHLSINVVNGYKSFTWKVRKLISPKVVTYNLHIVGKDQPRLHENSIGPRIGVNIMHKGGWYAMYYYNNWS